jgi:hypothetical protein
MLSSRSLCGSGVKRPPRLWPAASPAHVTTDPTGRRASSRFTPECLCDGKVDDSCRRSAWGLVTFADGSKIVVHDRGLCSGRLLLPVDIHNTLAAHLAGGGPRSYSRTVFLRCAERTELLSALPLDSAASVVQNSLASAGSPSTRPPTTSVKLPRSAHRGADANRRVKACFECQHNDRPIERYRRGGLLWLGNTAPALSKKPQH